MVLHLLRTGVKDYLHRGANRHDSCDLALASLGNSAATLVSRPITFRRLHLLTLDSHSP